jgi:hypothetical protein
MTPREILDAIRRGIEEAAGPFSGNAPQPAPLAQIKRPPRSIEQMTPREILDAIHQGLEETARQFAADGRTPTCDDTGDRPAP